MMENRTTHFVILSRYNEHAPESGESIVLDLYVTDAGKLVSDPRLLSVFTACNVELKNQGMKLTVMDDTENHEGECHD